MDLSIIIVNWNTHVLLEECLNSIKDVLFRGSYEIWVIDNASTDTSAEMVRTQFPQVHLIALPQNLGFARANNLGIERSSGNYLLLLNPDTHIAPGALNELVDFMDQHADAGAAGSRLLNPDGSLQVSCSPSPSLLREVSRLFHLPFSRPDGYYPMTSWNVMTPRQVDIVMGACIILRRAVLEQVGLLDEGYFMYSEEVDLCYRIRKLGWKIYWVPQAEITHYGGQSSKLAAREMFLHLYKGKIIYFRKHYGPWTAILYKSILFSAAFLRILISPLAFLGTQQRRQFHRKLTNNYVNLIRELPLM